MYKRIRIMKRLAFIMMALLLTLMPAAAQNYRDSRYYNKQTDKKRAFPPDLKVKLRQIGRAHVCTPVTSRSRMPSPA